MLKKVSKEKSTMFLYALKGALSRGLSIEKSIEMLSKTQPKPLNRYLKNIIFLIKKKNKKISDLLASYDILTKNEKIILEQAKDAKFAVSEIIKMRQIQGQFIKSFFTLIYFPILVLIFMPFLTKYMLSLFQKPINDMLIILKQKGIAFHYNIPKIFYYIYHPQWLTYQSIIIIVLAGGIIGSYFYLLYYKPSVLYKILKPSAFDDMPYILNYMSALNKVGFPVEKIAEILGKSDIRPGWKTFFKNMQKRIKNGEKIYVEFRKMNFPEEIVTYIQYDELNGNFWNSIDELKELAINRNKEINTFLMSKLKGIFTMLAFAIIIYFLIGVILLNFNLMNIANLLSMG